ncbi:MAG: (NiFe) hydrogenase maturation protein HypF, partial [Firmicutes bacterium]|nr:(NiFe) hydrogenase maturation protein HypF [Bacillota bacterium]
MDQRKNQLITSRITVYGMVQGVGFRPLVYHIAEKYKIKGNVRNLGGSVEIIAQAKQELLQQFITELSNTEDGGHVILQMVSTKCSKELFDPEDRRYRNPFISCVACGPRYTIMEDLPYDRETTSMVDFEMCNECHEEYTSAESRRHHAQTISCHDCGPYLIYEDANQAEGTSSRLFREQAFEHVAQILQAGGIVAVK